MIVQKHPTLYSTVSYCGSDLVTRLVLVTVVVRVVVVMGTGGDVVWAAASDPGSSGFLAAGRSSRRPVGLSRSCVRELAAGVALVAAAAAGDAIGSGLYDLIMNGSAAGAAGGGVAFWGAGFGAALVLASFFAVPPPPPPKKPFFAGGGTAAAFCGGATATGLGGGLGASGDTGVSLAEPPPSSRCCRLAAIIATCSAMDSWPGAGVGLVGEGATLDSD
jgi:hypothetical protein